MWILWWNAHHVPFTAEYWNAPAFAPAPARLVLSETLLGLTWLTTPLQWLGASPLIAYNVLVIATPILNGLSAYWLCLCFDSTSVTRHETPGASSNKNAWMDVNARNRCRRAGPCAMGGYRAKRSVRGAPIRDGPKARAGAGDQRG